MLRLTRAQVREVDRRAIENLHIPGVVLMENAARAVADAAWEMLGRQRAPVLVVCGGGNNGGDGLAAARHLSNRGVPVSLSLAVLPGKYTGDARINFEIVRAMGIVRKHNWSAELVIDALFGTGLSKEPRPAAARLIDRMNGCGKPILAVDVPSGLDCDTGQPLCESCVRATRTVTFVAEKAGFANPASKQYTGDIVIGDIGCGSGLAVKIVHMDRKKPQP